MKVSVMLEGNTKSEIRSSECEFQNEWGGNFFVLKIPVEMVQIKLFPTNF